MNDDQDYASLLKTLNDAPATPSEVSIDRAVRTGRRTVLRRRVGGALAAVAVIAAASISPLLDSARDRAPAPADPSPESQEFNLWSQEFETGSAAGFTPSDYVTARRWQQVMLKPTSTAIGKDATAIVTMYGPGFAPVGLPSPDHQVVGTIDGSPAYLIYQSPKAVQLTWKYARDSWGWILLTGAKAAQVERAEQVAEAVHLGVGKPVAVPFTIARSTLDGLSVVSVWSTIGAGPAYQRLVFDHEDPMHPPEQKPDLFIREPDLIAGVVHPAPAIRQTTTIDGHPAEVTATTTTIDLGNGYASQATVGGGTAFDVGHTAMARSMRLVPNPGDPATWTQDPIR